jgi:plastocyanin
MDQLNRYWNDVVQNRTQPPTDLDPVIAETIRRFHQRGEGPRPSASFVEHLQRDLEGIDVRRMTVAVPPRIWAPKAEGQGPTILEPQPHRVVGAPQMWRRVTRACVAAVLLLLATGVITFLVRSNSGDGSLPPGLRLRAPLAAVTEEPASASCHAQPRSQEEIASLTGLVTTREAGELPDRGESLTMTFPNGEQADAETVDDITATVRELTACAATTDYLRRWALVSDDYIRRLSARYGEHGDSIKELLASAATPAAVPMMILEVRQVRTLGDGRAAALLAVSDRPQLVGAIFIEQGGRWLLDDLGVVEPAGTPRASACSTAVEVVIAGTPVPSPVVADRAAIDHLVGRQATPVPPSVHDQVSPRVVAIEANDMYFVPDRVTIPGGTPVALTLVNAGRVLHNLTVDALGFSVDALPGETQTVTIMVPTGTYQFYDCMQGHREAGMVGVLVVTAAATPMP